MALRMALAVVAISWTALATDPDAYVPKPETPGGARRTRDAGEPSPAVLAGTLQPATVAVLLDFEHKPSAGFVKQLQKDLMNVFRRSGLDFRWIVLDRRTRHGVYNRMVILKMQGRCNPRILEEIREGSHGRVQLGWTVMSDDEVIPFSTANCDEVARMVWNMRLEVPSRLMLQQVYRRLLGRVMAHELMHALLRRAEHQNTECSRAILRPGDVYFETRLAPSEIAALREIGRPRPVTTLAKTAEPAGETRDH